ncbi:MAG: ammonium transporter [Gammaproteobacteria bacterium]
MIDFINLIWIAVCTILVFFMQAGFALVECGMARAKNAINVIMKNYTDMCFGALAFWLVGFGLMFGDSAMGFIGASGFAPAQLSSITAMQLSYQMMFAATAATIFSGAVAERMHYWSYLTCSVILTGLIYPVFGHWAWNAGGWLKQLGFIDFAGSTVVHSVGAWCALAGVIVLGPRFGRFSRDGEARDIPGHNLPLVALGGFILWLGWFGFNGGSIAGVEKDNLGLVLLNTHLGGCGGAVGALLYLGAARRPVLMSSTVNASLCGLVSVTAGAAYLSPIFAILSGMIGGIVCLVAAEKIRKQGIDDMVDAIAVHGFGGVWGTLAAGLFYAEDMFSPARIGMQCLGIGIAWIWAFPLSYLVFKLVDKTLGLRASTMHEQRGLDFTEHYEIGYPEFQQTLGGLNPKE